MDGGRFDQFKNRNTTYDERLYNTTIDASKLTAAQVAHAEKVQREIEGASTNNPHLAEERGQKAVEEENEEAMYSGVKRTVQNPKTFTCINKNITAKSVFTKIDN